MSRRKAPESGTGPAISSKQLDAVFGALAHPARRQILVSLYARGGSMRAGEIADRFKHSWPTTTRHLGVLERAGLLETGKAGRNRWYAITPALVRGAAAWISAWANDVAPPGERPDWADLSYAAMRNAIPPGSGRKR